MRTLVINEPALVQAPATRTIQDFLDASGWADAAMEPLAGDASSRRYIRLRQGRDTAVLMDASRNTESVRPFVHIDEHLGLLGFRAPAILARDETAGFLLLEDFGDETFARRLDTGGDATETFSLAIDLLAKLHSDPSAVPVGLRLYHPEKMLSDIELFLEWRTPGLPAEAQEEFQQAWRGVLPAAHQVPASLLLRDFHAGNLMLLPGAQGSERVGLLDFQDAYAGPITYDLMSLLEDARRDVPLRVQQEMMDRYFAHGPRMDRAAFNESFTILAAQRHTRVLAIFERLRRKEGKPDYARQHSPRIERLLQRALRHPILGRVRRWMERYAG